MEKKKEADKQKLHPVIGLPRALLYYRYRVLWRAFFRELGLPVKISPATTLATMERGTARAMDEMCLSTKIYLGHVEQLIGSCDYILVPRISNFGVRRYMCTRYEALYDICRNLFRGTEKKFLAYDVDVEEEGISEESAFVTMAEKLGFGRPAALKAYRKAKKYEEADWKNQVRQQEELYKKEGLKILLAAHSYVIEDPYIGKPIREFLEAAGITVLRADITDRKEALKQSAKFSPTMKWEVNREITGSVCANKGRVDGIILISVFPCGPDAMTNDLMVRKIRDIPILNLMLDGQTGTAGIETRLESFVDIIKMRRGEL